ncbi:hypothetical protein [Thermosynechococcus vestitus]|uniref:hypothetical protein n=1 Tax=Thermosynechococcus vestitus TaxID=146786 RepID=UPI0013E8D1E0|nr:hypothetical protein [Thermosynechococcus vestitus]
MTSWHGSVDDWLLCRRRAPARPVRWWSHLGTKAPEIIPLGLRQIRFQGKRRYRVAAINILSGRMQQFPAEGQDILHGPWSEPP